MSAAEAEAHKAVGNKALQAANYDEAIEAYTKALEASQGLTDAPRHVYFSNRSAAHMNKGAAAKALEDAENCIQASITWPKGYARKAGALHSLKRFDEAIATYEDGLKMAPQDSSLMTGLDSVRKAKEAANRPPPPKDNPIAKMFGPENLAKIAGHPTLGKYLGDPSFMQKIKLLQINPEGALQTVFQDQRMMEVFSFLSGINFKTPSPDEVMNDDSLDPPPAPKKEEKEKEPKRDPEVPEEKLTDAQKEQKRRKTEALVAKDRGNKHYSSRQFDEALAAYDEAIKTDPTNMSFYTNKAAVYFELGKFDIVINTCEEAIRVGRANRAPYADVAKAYVRMGKSHLKTEESDKAVQAFRQAQVEQYDKAIEKMIRQAELEAKKRAEQAYVDPEKAVEAKDRGNDHFRAGSWPEAVKEYEEAIRRDPKNPSYRNNLAAALAKLMDFPSARDACQKAIELDPKYVKAWAKKGDIEFFMKEYHKAMESYKRGLEFEPGHSLCQQGYQKTMERINASSSEMDMDRARHAMADPEIQAILSDPVIRQVLTDLQENPKYGQQALQDSSVRQKIEKLVAAGVLKVG